MKEPYYRSDLARIHDEGFGDYADLCAPGVLELLTPVLRRKGTVLELGCGSGALTRHLVAAGHRVIATDGSPAMVELATAGLPGTEVRLLALPTDPIPTADAIVSVGHVINYLGTEEEVSTALGKAAAALTPGGILVVDVCDLAYGRERAQPVTQAEIRDEWAVITRAFASGPDRYVRQITTFTKRASGGWRRDNELHENLLIDTDEMGGWFDRARFEVTLRDSFGSETLPTGIRVLLVERVG